MSALRVLRRVRAGVGSMGSAALLMALVIAPQADSQTLVFHDATEIAGLTAVHSPPGNVPTNPMVSGGAVGDFNRDGWQDLFVLGGGAVPDHLFMNKGNGRFHDRADPWRVQVAHVGVGTAVGDYDDDGWLDMYVTSHGTAAGLAPGQHRLYHNEGGRRFRDRAMQAGVHQTSPVMADGFGADFGDYDLDGDLDLFVAGWMFMSQANRLFRNQGDGTFDDVSADALLADLSTVRGFTPHFVDMNGDRYPEMLLAADFGTSRYLVNNRDGTFSDMTAPSGTGLDSNGMGQTVGDYDGDLQPDWFVTSITGNAVPGAAPPPMAVSTGMNAFTGNKLYMNQGSNAYLERGVEAGVKKGAWGWGCVSVDLNHDGLIDIVETNGWEGPVWGNQPTRLFMNAGGGLFTKEEQGCNLVHTGNGRGLLHFDADNDGDHELVIFAYAEPLRYYGNRLSGERANWVKVWLDTSDAAGLAPNGIGSKVYVTAGGRTQLRIVTGGGSYLSPSELSAHFGLRGAQVVDELRVEWNDGRVTTLTNVAINHALTVKAPR